MQLVNKNVLIVGAGKGGTNLINTLSTIDKITIVGIADKNLNAPGISRAKELGIKYSNSYSDLINNQIDIIFEATGSNEVYEDLKKIKNKKSILISGTIANLVMGLIEEKEILISLLKKQKNELDVIIDSLHDGLIAINNIGQIIYFNKTAEKILQKKKEEMIGEFIWDAVPNSRLFQVLSSGIAEIGQEQILDDNIKIKTNRIPIIADDGKKVGAVAVFQDISAYVHLSEEVTDLKKVKSLLQAIINSSEDAISVVDETGTNIMINPAYTRITGMNIEDVIGKPATVDISEGESMHLKVLKTKKPVRGVQMKVGPKRKDVIVNVAPILIEDSLKGSVAIIHDTTEIIKLTEELEKARKIIRTLEAKYTFDDIIGKSIEMNKAFVLAKKAAATSVTVLLRGESGTGKELFAHAIHNASERKFNQFVRVNCAAIPESLLESELFGYEEGAFTGAKRGGKKGLFEEANGGTIFLDEIGELSLGTQAKLLRVLQEKEIVRVGGSSSITINVRVIAATNVDLEKAIIRGNFREDLFYRLNVYPIFIPPLRDRKLDIEHLTNNLIKKFNIEYGRMVEGIAEKTLKELQNYNWPGNVRELENVIGRAMINMKYNDKIILPEHLPTLITPKFESHLIEGEDIVTLENAVSNFEKRYIEKILNLTEGNKTKTAKVLGISIRNLYYKLDKYHFEQ